MGDDDVDSSSSSELPTFTDWFLDLPGREIYLQVPIDFIQDEFNLYDLHGMSSFENALNIVLDDEPPNEDVLQDEQLQGDLIALYELLHQKYIITRAGLHEMWGRFALGDFGKCPRTFCEGTFVLPYGAHSIPHQSTLKLYCPRCQDIYIPPSRRQARLDGCGFGPTFAHLFVLQYKERFPPWTSEQEKWSIHEPRIFGFRINKESSMAPKLGWLRSQPDIPR